MSTNLQKRVQKFGQTFTINDIRTKRIDNGIKLRKQKRSEHTIDKRSLIAKGGTSQSECIYKISLLSPELYESYPHLFHSSCTFSSFLSELNSCTNKQTLIFFVISLRKFLSSSNRPIAETIASNVPYKLITLMQFPNFTKDCVWCLINLTSESVAKNFIPMGIIDELLLLFDSKDPEILDLSVWCLGNIAGEDIDCRDKILEMGFLARIVKLLKIDNCCTNALWCLSNLCKGRPYPSKMVRETVLVNCSQFLDSKNEEIVKLACEAIFYTTNDVEKEEFKEEIIEKVVGLLEKNSLEVRFKSLKIIGNFVLKSDDVIKVLINLGILDKLLFFVNSHHLNIKKEALLTLSNICSGPDENLPTVINHKICKICVGYLKDDDFSIKNEVLCIIKNLLASDSCSNSEIFGNALEIIVSLFEVQNPNILKNVLEVVDFMLYNFELKGRFEEIGGVDAIEKLQLHPNGIIYHEVIKIMEKHYGIEEACSR